MFAHTSIALSAVALLCLAVLPGGSEAARILGYFPTPSKSHLIVHMAVAEALAEHGHEVTVFTTSHGFSKNPKVKVVVAEVGSFSEQFVSEMVSKPQPVYRRFTSIIGQVSDHANRTLNHPTTQAFLKEHKNSFDLMIFGYFMNDYHLGLGAYFNCPIVISLMIQPIFPINRMLANPREMAYVPTLFGNMKQPLHFLGRVKNFLISMSEEFILTSLMDLRMNKLYSEAFPADEYPSLNDMYKNVSLVLTNHHFSQGPIRPNVPALVEIGGIQVKEKPSPLPADLAAVLDNAREGVIYFSLGSNIRGSNLSKDKVKVMFDVLSKLPYKVLWKWGDTQPPGQADNIVFKSWLPQDDILAHPNVKLFITHGGMGSVVESQYHGVPMVGIPLFAEQPANMMGVERAGFGLKLDYLQLTEHSLREAIEEVIRNPKYKDAVQRFSALYRDRPMTARQTAVYWVEYVLRHRGAPHMQSPAVHLSFCQKHSLDVIAFLLLIIAGAIGSVVGLCKVVCCRRNKAVNNTKTKGQKNKRE